MPPADKLALIAPIDFGVALSHLMAGAAPTTGTQKSWGPVARRCQGNCGKGPHLVPKLPLRRRAYRNRTTWPPGDGGGPGMAMIAGVAFR
jgi:hypothetical protein